MKFLITIGFILYIILIILVSSGKLDSKKDDVLYEYENTFIKNPTDINGNIILDRYDLNYKQNGYYHFNFILNNKYYIDKTIFINNIELDTMKYTDTIKNLDYNLMYW